MSLKSIVFLNVFSLKEYAWECYEYVEIFRGILNVTLFSFGTFEGLGVGSRVRVFIVASLCLRLICIIAWLGVNIDCRCELNRWQTRSTDVWITKYCIIKYKVSCKSFRLLLSANALA